MFQQQLRELVHDMAGLSGNNYIQQSHKCRLTTGSINSFLQMAKQYDPLCKSKKNYNFIPPMLPDIYKKGMIFIKDNYKSVHTEKIQRFNPVFTLSFDELQLEINANTDPDPNGSDDDIN
ncbi:hypothetical protein MJO29_010440 [Puccinia striiformis f. sp. tritici]|nr:hypothetical protein MJO29_010440 [Puccinia striiformis f. sp. tritici]